MLSSSIEPAIKPLVELEDEAAIKWLQALNIAQLEEVILLLKSVLIDTKLNNFTFTEKVKLYSRFSVRPNYTPDQFMEKKIAGIIQITDEIQKQSLLSMDAKSYKKELINIAAFLSETKNCIDDIIGFRSSKKANSSIGNGEIDNQKKLSPSDARTAINNRVKRYLKNTNTQRNFVEFAWRKLTKPITELCKGLTSSVSNVLTEVGLFSKQHGSDHSTWSNLTDKTNTFAHTLRNVSP